ncbi:SpoIIE family protein phosphatase [Anaerobacillus isosaccharinicus]|uniref:SpoIIE family protein phosphatase n=1 Tax=Anaerobacillus isosaccharinicus TaxID=1532552 RepID=A0A1S2LGD6_9BACI|nr:SpoIIE family protein phosphatase [Anaerobacillus isosaccharinicus]MBA5587771.1 SpoIIE family protein phosphatase [Anaerobacillus isosaccharinicus]QOY34071.1 SpoIIE family protein phosphatase [Anaerobacillus isosaccharinicus]
MDAAIRVLMVGKDEGMLSFIQNLIKEDATISCSFISNIELDNLYTDSLTNAFQNSKTDIIILCDSIQQFSILELIRLFKQNEIFNPIIVISNRNETSLAVEVMKAGGENFLVQEKLTTLTLIDAIYSALQSRDEKQQHEKIRLENQKLLKAIEQSSVSIVITDAKTNKIEYANPMFTTLTGYTFGEIKGKSPSLLKSGTKTKEDYRELWDTILAGRTWRGEFINRKKNGGFYFVSAVVSPIKLNNDEITHYVGIHQDITKRKEAEFQMKNYAKKLEKKSRELEIAYEDIEANIQRAKQLHRHFFPISLPIIDHIHLEAFYEPAHKIGSDYYNFIKLNQQLIFYIVDISGSGIAGAFINVFIRQKINRFLYVHNQTEHVSPKELLNFLAKHFIEESFPEEYYACLYVAVLNINSNELTYSNAGIQVPPILIHEGQLENLQLGGLPISAAIPMELLSFEEETIRILPETTLVITTDGIVESSMNGEMFGIERLQQLVLENAYLPPKELKEVINTVIDPMLQKQKNKDDITYVIVQHSCDPLDKREYVIQSDCYDVECVVSELTQWLEPYTSEINSLLVGFNEMVYNAIEHGNKFEVSKKIKINIMVKKTHLMISIEDEGDGFDWKTRIKREFDLMNFEERGRGIIFTKASFNHITYNEKGNQVFLYRKI